MLWDLVVCNELSTVEESRGEILLSDGAWDFFVDDCRLQLLLPLRTPPALVRLELLLVILLETGLEEI